MDIFKAGDIVHIKLLEADADALNSLNPEQGLNKYRSQIVGKEFNEEPLVKYTNLYMHGTGTLYNTIEEAQAVADQTSISILMYEWEDGDTSKSPKVSVI